MVAIVTRAANGTELSWEQMDANLINLANAVDGVGSDVIAEATAAKDAAVLAATASQSAAASSNSSAIAAAASVVSLSAPGGSTLIGFLADGVGAVLRRVFDKLLETISTKDYGAVGDGTTNDAAAVVKANTKAGKRPLVFIGVSHVGTPTTITAPISDTMEQIFSVTSQVTIDNGRPIRPEWFGTTSGNILRAIAAAPSTGAIIRLENATYPPQGIAYGITGTGNFISKEGIKIEGAKMPALRIDCLSLVGGTIIQGMLGVYADNFEISNVGIDSGYNVINAFAGGVITPGQWEGLICSYPDDATKNAVPAPLRRGLRLHNVIALTLSPTALVHSIIAGEGYTDVTCAGEIVGCYGLHGIVFKCGQVSAEELTSYGSSGEGVIIKSDAQSTAVAKDIQIGRIATYAGGPVGWTPYAVATTGSGTMFQATGNTVGVCQIGSIIDYGHPVGVASSINSGFSLDNIQIGRVTGEGNSTATVSMTAPAGGSIFRCSIGQISSRNSGTGLLTDWATGDALSVDYLSAVNCNVALDDGGSAGLAINKISAAGCILGAIRLRGQVKPLIGTVVTSGSTPSMYASDAGGLVPVLASGWTQVAASEKFSASLEGFGVSIYGLVHPTTGGQVSQLPIFARPKTAKRVIAQGFNGTTISPVPVVIDESGVISVNEVAGGFANCSTWLSLAGIHYDLTS